MKRWLAWFVILGLMCGLLVPAVRAAEKPPVNVILIGWDGAQRDHVNECLEKGELPNLKRLAADGAMVNIDVKGVTDTKAGWTEILTGCGPQVTGVYSNGRFQPIPEGLTVFERLRAHFGKDEIATVAVIAKKNNVGEIDPPKKVRLDAKEAEGKAAQGKIIEEDGVKYRLAGGSPYYYTHKNVDVWEFGLIQDEKVGTKALEMLDKYKDKPFIFFVHFAEVDQKGHAAGENSKAYNGALISNDNWTGKIMDKVKELGLADKTLIYVTADHGFDEGKRSHDNAPFVFLATNDKQVGKAGTRADITPTILERYGLDLGKLTPPLDGKPLTK